MTDVARRVKRRRDGSFELILPPEEVGLVETMAAQVTTLLDAADEPLTRRLFPPAYVDDPEAEAEYRSYVRDELTDRRRENLATLVAATAQRRLDPEEALACLGAVNDIRLVIGTRLDLSEETDFGAVTPADPDFGLYLAYEYLTALLGEFLRELR